MNDDEVTAAAATCVMSPLTQNTIQAYGMTLGGLKRMSGFLTVLMDRQRTNWKAGRQKGNLNLIKECFRSHSCVTN